MQLPLGNSRPSFSQWVRAQTYRTDIIGELAKQIRKEKFLPAHIQRLHLYLTYFQHQPKWRAAVKKAYAEWQGIAKQERLNRRNEAAGGGYR
jgi:hypothetical protein